MRCARPTSPRTWSVPDRDLATQQRLIRPLLMLEFAGFEADHLKELATGSLEAGPSCVTLRSVWHIELASATLKWRAARHARFLVDPSEPCRERVVRAAMGMEERSVGVLASNAASVDRATDVASDLACITALAQEALRGTSGAVGVAHAIQAIADVPGWSHPAIDSDVAVTLALEGVLRTDAAVKLQTSESHRIAAAYAQRMMLGYGREIAAIGADHADLCLEYRTHHVAVAFMSAALAWREWTACGWGIGQLEPWFHGIPYWEPPSTLVAMLD